MRNSWLIRVCASICCIGMLPLLAAAQDPPSRNGGDGASPTTQPDQRPQGRRFGPGGWRAMSPEEREAFNNFIQEHMPNLYKLLSESRGPARFRLRSFALARMRSLEQVKNDQALTDKITKNIEAEDELFAYIQELQQASDPAAKSAAREKIRGKLREIVDNFLNERARRIEKLKSRLADEEKKLKEDQNNRDQLVEKRVNQFLREFTREPLPDDNQDQQPSSINAAPQISPPSSR